MTFARRAALALAFVCACSQPQGPATTPSAAEPSAVERPAPKPSAAPSATAPPALVIPFPDVTVLAGTVLGELTIYRRGTWQLEAKICPPAEPYNPVAALHLGADGRIAFVQCAREIAGTADRARDAFTFDLVTKERRPVSGTNALGLGPISPDGRRIVVAEPGACPGPAPVCQTRRSLLDVVTGAREEILPSEYWLDTELRWTAAGLTYYRPECSSAGCTGAQNAGTFSYSFGLKRWTRISSDRLVAADGAGRTVFERRSSLEQQTGVAIFEVVHGTERRLTPAGVEQEIASGLLPDGRAVAWRPDRAGGSGEMVVYREGAELQRGRGRFSGSFLASSGTWLFAGGLSGAPAWTVLAYSADANAFATLAPTFSLQRFVVLPGP